MRRQKMLFCVVLMFAVICTAFTLPAYALDLDPCANGHTMVPTDGYSTRWVVTSADHAQYRYRRYNCRYCGAGTDVLVQTLVPQTSHSMYFFNHWHNGSAGTHTFEYICSPCGHKQREAKPCSEPFHEDFLRFQPIAFQVD